MTAPKASRHRVAVRRMLYSSGCVGPGRVGGLVLQARDMLAPPSAPAADLLPGRRHEVLERAPAGLVVGELVEARTRGREQDHLAGARHRPRGSDRVAEV